jgi:hypothetical protein
MDLRDSDFYNRVARPIKGVYAQFNNPKSLMQGQGVFIEWVRDSVENRRGILWSSNTDSWKVLSHKPQNLCIPKSSDDIFLRYVSLKDMSGISVAVYSDRILNIIAHNRVAAELSLYTRHGDYATWVHLPVKSKEILGIWWVHHPNPKYTSSALMVSKVARRFELIAENDRSER